MGMTGAGMASAVVSAIEGAFPGMTAGQITQLQASATALCDAIVTYIQGNAVVNVTSVSGVMSGGGTSGPGTGSIS